MDWNSIKKAIAVHYVPVSGAATEVNVFGVAICLKILLVEIWNGSLSDESVENMANKQLRSKTTWNRNFTKPAIQHPFYWITAIV